MLETQAPGELHASYDGLAMSMWDAWARGYRNGRIIGAILLLPVAFGMFHLMTWCMSDRRTVELSAPPYVELAIDGEPIPVKSALNYGKASRGNEALQYAFTIDEGSYTLRATVDGETALELPVVVAELGVVIDIIEDEEGGLRVDDGGGTSERLPPEK